MPRMVLAVAASTDSNPSIPKEEKRRAETLHTAISKAVAFYLGRTSSSQGLKMTKCFITPRAGVVLGVCVYLFCFVATPGSAQVLHLALYSGMSPGNAAGTLWGAGY